MENEWEDLRDSETDKARIKAQQDWAKRREAHFQNPDPGVWHNITRMLGNMVSNNSLERAERKDQTWKHHEQDLSEGGYVLNSPVDNASFKVYEDMLKAHKQGIEPSRALQEEWSLIKRGQIPEHRIKD